MIVETQIGNRLHTRMNTVEDTVRIASGPSAISVGKIASEGRWSVSRILLGVMVTIESDEIALRREKVEVSRRRISQSVYDTGTMLATGHALQELRGYYTHWCTANPKWHSLARPVDLLLGGPCPEEIWGHGASPEIWVAFRPTISWVREQMGVISTGEVAPDETWPAACRCVGVSQDLMPHTSHMAII